MFYRSEFAARLGAALLAFTVIAFPSLAYAQADLGQSDSDWTFRLGGGVLYAPAFPGSNDYQLNALPYVFVSYRDVFEASVQRGARYNIFRGERFTAGPIARLDFGRREDGDNTFRVAGPVPNTLQGMGDIDTTVELGGFVEYEIEPFTASLELRQAVSGHDGFVGRFGIQYSQQFNPFGGFLILQIEPGIRFAGGSFTQAYFGVTPTQSANTGIPVYNAGGGIYSYGIEATFIVPLSANFFAAIVTGYDNLSGDAQDSPFVAGSGTANQSSVGFLLAWQFGG